MEQVESRLEKGLMQWQECERRYEKLGIDFKIFRNLKLEHLNKLRAGYAGSKHPQDRMDLRVLNAERRKLERELYPDLLVRLIVRGINTIRSRNAVRRDNVQADKHIARLGKEMYRAGFGSLVSKMEQQVKQGNREFSLPVSFHVSEKERMDYLVHFKQGSDGKCQLNGYNASLSGPNPDGKRRHSFQNDGGRIHPADQAYQLLSGRPVHNGMMWQQFDFNDKDAGGNYRQKNFQNSYGFDLKQSLSALPLKESQGMEQLLKKLRNGERADVTLNINGKEGRYVLEANPQKKEVSIFEPSGSKVTLQQLRAAHSQENKTFNVLNMVPKQANVQVKEKSNVRRLEPQKNIRAGQKEP